MNGRNIEKMAAWGIFGILLAIPLAVVAATILRGWVLLVLWGWFIVPLGAPPVTLPIAIGVCLIMAVARPMNYKKDDSGELWGSVASVFIAPLLTLGIGWVVTLFM